MYEYEGVGEHNKVNKLHLRDCKKMLEMELLEI